PARLVLAADLPAQRLDTLVQRRRLDGPGTNAVAADALADEVHRHRLGEADHGRLGGAVDVAVGRGLAGSDGGGDVDDGAAALGQHAGQERLDRAVHGLDVEIEGEVPVGIG